MTSRRWLGRPQGCALDERTGALRGRSSDVVTLFRTAQADRHLLDELMALPSRERLDQAAHQPLYHRLTLAQLLMLHAQIALFDPEADPTTHAELGVAVALALPRDSEGRGLRAAAMAHWLLGKGLLRARRFQQAEGAFRAIFLFVDDLASEERGLAFAGLAQAREDQGDLDGAGACWLESAVLFSAIGSTLPTAACHAQRAFQSFESGDFPRAVTRLDTALRLLEAAVAPSLTIRAHLALAEARAAMGDHRGAQFMLDRARTLYELPAPPFEGIERRWREARIAWASGQHSVAQQALAGVRNELLRCGSLEEAARSTLDLLLLHRGGDRTAAVGELLAPLLYALAPDAGAAAALESLMQRAIEQPGEAYTVAVALRRLLGQIPLHGRSRPPRITASRLLVDRLLRGLAEHEDPLGASQL